MQPLESRFPPAAAGVPINRSAYLRDVIGYLVETLEEVVGASDTAGFVALVGRRIGEEIDVLYREAIGRTKLTRAEVADVLVDLQRRLGGDFYVFEQDDTRIVLGNLACPFAERVQGHATLCMTTSSLCGVITAQNLGYARVEIENAIAHGDAACRIVIHLVPPPPGLPAAGREYYKL
ncbi:MAG TPA: methanogen output domain 1-containing protein [Xanthomonadales bacterium]|nr:methanogen output domain 1-containing protein [Xanthomonadales bacterium]